MKFNRIINSGIFHPRVLIAFSLSSVGMVLALGSLLWGPQRVVAQTTSGARILVTTTVQKIGGIGTGGCSLQEAIYSSTLHDSLDGGQHGIAIDATDPDHFITTECTMGTGNGDIIILPVNGIFNLTESLDGDAYNYMGPTTTPMIFSTMTIEAYGATLAWTGKGNSRLFAIGTATVKTPNGTASGTGAVTIRNAYIKGFHMKGGDGGLGGGGGGLGAGGAIYVNNGTLIIETSTFDTNGAVGGNGNFNQGGAGGGGGGLSGNGGEGQPAGAGGGGARGNGGKSTAVSGNATGGGGGGTIFSGGNGRASKAGGGSGGYLCGGGGGSVNGPDAHAPTCQGGGGGGAGTSNSAGTCLGTAGDGASGAYGGGGGGGAANGGNGGFGGGGGGGDGDGCSGNGGAGGFGGGGGWGFSAGGPGPGAGGPFGGNGGGDSDPSVGGGGGGALGGAIFNDSGSLTIHNSTFLNNFVTRGIGANNGGDAGGAVFSRDGTTTIVNCTFSNNQSTGSGGGVVIYSDRPPRSVAFTIQDTILANNGANECFYSNNVSISGAGNLIMSNGSGTQPFGSCPGVVTTADPQLSALQPPSVTGKYTPTMEIPLYSSAMGVADPGTSLPYDQRFADRPQPDSQGRNGYDIGAFTVCRRYLAGLRYWSCSETHIPPPPQQESLTINASPSGDGTTNPVPGSYNEDLNSVVAIKAIPSSGNHFLNWTGNVAQPTNPSTTVTMSQPQTVTANFAAGAASADLQVTVSDGKSSVVAGVQNTYTILVTNAGPSYVSGAIVKDTFPATFSVVAYTAVESGGAFGYTASGSGNINDTVTMPPGSSVTYTATGKVASTATGTVADTASVKAPTGITDPNAANNTATDTDTVTFKCDLKVTVNDGKTAATAGTKSIYTIVVSNLGPSKVVGAIVHDAFPTTFTGVTYTATQGGGATGFTASGSGNINDTVTLPVSSTITYKATGTISAAATGSISDSATIAAPSGTTDPVTGNNSATDTDTL